jgi:hypothetical protein
MSPQESFSFQTSDELRRKAEEFGIELPYEESSGECFKILKEGRESTKLCVSKE